MIGQGKSRSDKFFGAVDDAVDWRSLEEALQVVYSSRTGRPSHPPLMLFKILLIQRWYNLSDPAVEDALNDRKSFARFVGLSLDQSAPDHSVISRFRSQLDRMGLLKPLLDELHRQIEAKQLILKQGTLLDATLIGSAARPPPAPRPKSKAKGKAQPAAAARGADPGQDPAKTQEPPPAKPPPPADPFVSGKSLLIVDDIWDSGKTISAVKGRVLAAGGLPSTAVLHYKPTASMFTDVPDYYVEATDAWIVYPWEPASESEE
jgi:IS5 family transposase